MEIMAPVSTNRVNDIIEAVAHGEDRDSVVTTPDEEQLWDQVAAESTAIADAGWMVDVVPEQTPPEYMSGLNREGGQPD